MSFPRLFLLLSILGATALAGCRLVDEDLTGCGEEFSLDYELQLVTNMRTEIQTVLDLQADLEVATNLQDHLGEVFTDYAHDVDLSFYDTVEPWARLEHIDVVMDASQSSYSLYLPGRDYVHTCVANLEEEPYVTLENDGYCYAARLVQHPSVQDTVEAHTTGIFTARTHMNVISGTDQSFDVELYMVNAATTLILDLADAPDVRDLKVFLSGFADGFMLADSTYTFNTAQVVRTTLLPVEDGSTERCYASIHFPSRDVEADTKMVIDIPDPDSDRQSDEILWSWTVEARLADGSVTRSVVGSYNPLHAAQLKVVKGVVHERGVVSSGDPTVGVSVTLDWQPGQEHEIDL